MRKKGFFWVNLEGLRPILQLAYKLKQINLAQLAQVFLPSMPLPSPLGSSECTPSSYGSGDNVKLKNFTFLPLAQEPTNNGHCIWPFETPLLSTLVT